MGLHGKLTAAIEFKAGGDVFHEIFKQKPHHLSTTSPGKVHGCDLIEGEFGHVGTIICWTYTHEGKEKKAKQKIKLIDEEKKLIDYEMLEGSDLLEKYKFFDVTIHVETNIDLVTWTVGYERLNEDVFHRPNPRYGNSSHRQTLINFPSPFSKWFNFNACLFNYVL